MSPEMVRRVVSALLEPDHAGEFTDVLMLRAVAADGRMDKPVRLDAQEKAELLFGELVDAVAAELALREPVAA